MSFNRAQVIDENFLAFLRTPDVSATAAVSPEDPVRPQSALTGGALLELFESQLIARHLDLVARTLRAQERAFYTIGSAGHEGNVVLGRVCRHTDPAFLHYRSAALMVERSRAVPSIDPVYDTVLSTVASAEDPIAGGRHKVWGSAPLWVLPQTSTIASHLPKAVGTAIGLRRAKRLGLTPPVPPDSIILCSFGDATTNHSTALGAFNAAQWAAFQQLPVPILFVCEDNGLGISVRTPPGWVEANFSNRPGIRYFRADGLDVVEAYDAAVAAAEYCRSHRMPAFLHLKVVRLLGHAGTDFEPQYHGMEEIQAAEARDPVLKTARTVLQAGLLDAEEIRERYEAIRTRVADAAEQAVRKPRLASATEILAPLAPLHADRVHAEATRPGDAATRLAVFGSESKFPERAPPRHLAVQINQALFDIMAKYPEAIVFGEDVAIKGGVYHVTADLYKAFRSGRVFNTQLDEQSILGLAQGAAYMGLLPIAEIQYLAYFHNACDQIRGEACSTQFFSMDQFRNPMIVRIASLAYQKGFGGHFHNDNSIAALRDIPGLIVACPSRGDDAAGMLRTCAALAKVNGRVIAFLEPIALYMTKDLHAPGDGGWQFAYPPPGEAVPFGEGRAYNDDASDVLIVTFGNGAYMSLRAAKTLRDADGLGVRVLDLRWLNPLNTDWIAEHAAQCRAVLVVDEGRRTGGISESIVTALVEAGLGDRPIRRVVGADTYIPLGPAANLVLPSEHDIVAAARALSAEALEAANAEPRGAL